jgi:hypothetical protein
MAEIVGTKNDDLIDGTADDDLIRGRNGNDRLRGRLGNDEIHGGGSDDTVTGNEGDDVLYGEDGFDKINGNDGNDTAYGGDKADRIYGHAGEDILNGDGGNDTIYGGLDNDTIDGGRGIDRLYGDEGDDLIHGGGENDKLFGGDGQDTLYGDDGNDGLNGKAGDDTLHGGAGNDSLNGNIGDDILYGDEGSDRLYGHEGSDTLNGGTGNDFLFGGDDNDTLNGDAGADYIDAGSGADTLTGGLGNDVVKGRGGADTLFGGGGNDTVNGGKGDDTISGGTGDDKLVGGRGADTFVVSIQGGADTVTDFKIADDVIDLTQLALRQPGQSDSDVYADLIFTPAGTGGSDTIVTFAGASGIGVSLLLKNVKSGDLSVGNFAFDDGNENTAPTITSAASVEVAENQTAALTVQAEDIEGNPLSYSLSGTDAVLFDIEAATGVVSFKSAPDHEAPGDAGRDNVYNVVVTASDGTDSTDQAVDITVTNINDTRPVFSSDAAVSILENTTGLIYTALALDPDGDPVSYRRGEGDIAFFSLNELTGELSIGITPDFEDPHDTGANNQFEVQIIASDGTNESSMWVSVSILNENDNAPIISSGATATVAENQTAAYSTLATDADGLAALSYLLSGTDAALFDIDGTTGAVTFKVAPDYENPGDAGGDNAYDIVVTASDGTNTTDQAVAISVTDVEENLAAPIFQSKTVATATENQLAAYTARAVDADGDLVSYSISGVDAERFNIDASTGHITFKNLPDFENRKDANRDNVFDIVVTASDGSLSTDQSVFISLQNVLEVDRIDLTTLIAETGLILVGSRAGGIGSGNSAGFSVSGGGDTNGDGLSDVIVGSIDANVGEQNLIDAGQADIVYGSADPSGSIDPAGRLSIVMENMSSDQGYSARGENRADHAGWEVSITDDINGDGLADIIIGAHKNDDGGALAGKTYVIYGRREQSSFDLPAGGESGFYILGDDRMAQAGLSVSGAGDFNGDGFDDILIGAPGDGIDEYHSGQVYVILGGKGASGQIRFRITGADRDDIVGVSVSSAGDFNGDGFDDLLLGASQADPVRNFPSGAAYVVFGSNTSLDDVDLGSFDSSQGFVIQGDAAGDGAGISVSDAGDVNGDGYDDIIIGAHRGNDGGSDAGEAYVIFGKASGFGVVDDAGRSVLDLTGLDASDGFVIQGDRSGDRAGWSVSSAGDFDGDGYDDVLLGAFQGDDGGGQAGEAYIIFGKAGGFGRIDLTGLSLEDGIIIQGDESGDIAGSSVAGAGDFNGDGFDDVIIGANFGDDGGFGAGEAYVVYGGAREAASAIDLVGTSSADSLIGSALDDVLTGGGGADVIRAGAGHDVIGVSDNTFGRIHGGRGDDTLRIDGSGVHLDFTAIAQNTVTDIERIDLTGSGDNTLTLTVLDLFDMMEARENGSAVLRVTGVAGDVVNLGDGSWSASGQITENSITFNRYTNGNGEVRVQDGLGVSTSAQPLNPTKLTGDVMDGLDPAVVGIDLADFMSGNGLALGRDPHGFLSLLASEDLPLDIINLMNQLDGTFVQDWRADMDAAADGALLDRFDVARPDHDGAGFAVLSDRNLEIEPLDKAVPVMDEISEPRPKAQTDPVMAVLNENGMLSLVEVDEIVDPPLPDGESGWM